MKKEIITLQEWYDAEYEEWLEEMMLETAGDSQHLKYLLTLSPEKRDVKFAADMAIRKQREAKAKASKVPLSTVTNAQTTSKTVQLPMTREETARADSEFEKVMKNMPTFKKR